MIIKKKCISSINLAFSLIKRCFSIRLPSNSMLSKHYNKTIYLIFKTPNIMKTFNLLFVLSIFIFASCETADLAQEQNNADLKFADDSSIVLVDDDPAGNNNDYRFTAFLNGVRIDGGTFQVSQTVDELVLVAENSEASFSIKVPADIRPGDYTIESSSIRPDDFSGVVTWNGVAEDIVRGEMTILTHTMDSGNIIARFRFITRNYEVKHGFMKFVY